MIASDWIDRHGLVKARIAQSDTGNGLLYTAIYFATVHATGGIITQADMDYFNGIIKQCTIKPGLYGRSPEFNYGQETFDDYLGLVVWAIITDNTELARDIFWYGIRHAGCYNTYGDAAFKDKFLWRSFQVFWGLLPVAAFPWLRFIWWPVMWFTSLFMNAVDNNPAKVYLDWMYLYGASERGFNSYRLDEADEALYRSLVTEMDVLNPTVMNASRFGASHE